MTRPGRWLRVVASRALGSPAGRPGDEVTEHVGLAGAPAAVLARSTVRGPAYLDHYVLVDPAGTRNGTRTDARSAEECARVMFEHVGGAGAQAIWRILGLRLDARPSPDRVAGWTVDGRGGDDGDDGEQGQGWIRLHTTAWWGRAELIVQQGPDRIALTTVTAYDRPAGRAVWGVASAVHRRLVPGLLRDTRRALGRAARS